MDFKERIVYTQFKCSKLASNVGLWQNDDKPWKQ